MKNNLSWQYINGALFFAIIVIVCVLLVVINSQADLVTQTVGASNVSPVVDSVSVSASSYGSDATTLTLTENTTTTVYVWGTATDDNGCEDIDATSNYAMQLYRTNHASTFSCSADDNDCYRATSATTVDQCTAGGSDVTARYQFAVSVNYYADPTDTGAPQSATTWTGRVIVTDDDAAASSAVTDTVEMGSLVALDVTSSIAYGTIALGATSSEQTTTITNSGNRAMDAEVSADGDMTCTTLGSVSVGQAKWSLSTGFVYASAGTALSTSPVSTDNSTAQRTGASTTTPLYWKVQLPSSGIKGSCSNSITFTAIADV